MKHGTRVVAASLVFALALTACGGKDEAAAKPAAAPSAALAVELTAVTSASLTRAVAVSGAIAPWQEMQLGVELSGNRVAEVQVEVGDVVKRGDVLLTLDARTLKSELRQAEALMKEAASGVLLAQSQLNRGDAMKARNLISEADHELWRSGMVQAQARAVPGVVEAEGWSQVSGRRVLADGMKTPQMLARLVEVLNDGLKGGFRAVQNGACRINTRRDEKTSAGHFSGRKNGGGVVGRIMRGCDAKR